MSYETGASEPPPVTDWVTDWDWLDPQWTNLARLEPLVALHEWIRAFPDHELDASRETTRANGQVRGPRNIPVLLHR